MSAATRSSLEALGFPLPVAAPEDAALTLEPSHFSSCSHFCINWGRDGHEDCEELCALEEGHPQLSHDDLGHRCGACLVAPSAVVLSADAQLPDGMDLSGPPPGLEPGDPPCFSGSVPSKTF